MDLVRINTDEAETLWKMQVEAFQDLYKKYQVSSLLDYILITKVHPRLLVERKTGVFSKILP